MKSAQSLFSARNRLEVHAIGRKIPQGPFQAAQEAFRGRRSCSVSSAPSIDALTPELDPGRALRKAAPLERCTTGCGSCHGVRRDIAALICGGAALYVLARKQQAASGGIESGHICPHSMECAIVRVALWHGRRAVLLNLFALKCGNPTAPLKRSGPLQNLGGRRASRELGPPSRDLEGGTPVRPCPLPILLKTLSIAQEHQGAHSRARPRSSTPTNMHLWRGAPPGGVSCHGVRRDIAAFPCGGAALAVLDRKQATASGGIESGHV